MLAAMVLAAMVLAAMLQAASNVRVGRWDKRETAMVSCNHLDTWHYGDRVILFAGL